MTLRKMDVEDAEFLKRTIPPSRPLGDADEPEIHEPFKEAVALLWRAKKVSREEQLQSSDLGVAAAMAGRGIGGSSDASDGQDILL